MQTLSIIFCIYSIWVSRPHLAQWLQQLIIIHNYRVQYVTCSMLNWITGPLSNKLQEKCTVFSHYRNMQLLQTYTTFF